MKNFYSRPECEVSVFMSEDIITVSGLNLNNDGEQDDFAEFDASNFG